MNRITITAHAQKRAHQRLSLKKKSVFRAACNAYEKGKRAEDASPNDPYILGNMYSITSSHILIKYGCAYYIFDENISEITLITVLTAPKNTERLNDGGIQCYK